jgi:hypothetical protein
VSAGGTFRANRRIVQSAARRAYPCALLDTWPRSNVHPMDRQIFFPMIALAALTFAVLFLIPFKRFGAALRGRVTPNDFKYGESAASRGT